MRKECAAAPAEIRPLLEYVAKHLWDFDLVAVLIRRVGKKRRLRDGFGETLGCPPGAYVRDRRMEVAFSLLRETLLSAKEIGRLVGYETAQKFNDAFKACTGGLTPQEWRQAAAGSGVPVGGLVHADSRLWLRALASPWLKGPSGKAGGVPPDVALALLAYALKAAPRWWLGAGGTSGAEEEPDEPVTDDFTYEVFKAASVWKVAESRPSPLRKAAVRYPVPMKSLVLFELLSDMSRGCTVAAEGRELAELARCSLDACAGPAAEWLPDARGLAWVRLGRLALLDDEGPAAERALGFADVECAAGNEPSVRARRLEAKAELAFDQDRHDAATELAGKALDVYSGLEEHDGVARCLLLREKARGRRPDPAGPDVAAELEDALEALGATGPPEVTQGLRAELTAAYVRSGALEKAKAVIGKMEKERGGGDPV